MSSSGLPQAKRPSFAPLRRGELGRSEPESHQNNTQRVNKISIRIQRIAPSKATELCTAAYTIAKALKTIANAIV